ncbi:MAG: hypothetical protein JXA66_06530 [Oligoflexia bacterium]|nr:hypothetical protein [Oligoflexia bacterium]
MYKIYNLSLIVFLLFFYSCGETEEVDLLVAIVESFEDAVYAQSDDSLMLIVSETTNDYDILNAGEYFTDGEGTIFSEYVFDYQGCSSVITGYEGESECSAVASSRSDGTPVSFAISATFSFLYEGNAWKISELRQTRQANGEEEVLLDELNPAEKRLIELLENNLYLY